MLHMLRVYVVKLTYKRFETIHEWGFKYTIAMRSRCRDRDFIYEVETEIIPQHKFFLIKKKNDNVSIQHRSSFSKCNRRVLSAFIDLIRVRII